MIRGPISAPRPLPPDPGRPATGDLIPDGEEGGKHPFMPGREYDPKLFDTFEDEYGYNNTHNFPSPFIEDWEDICIRDQKDAPNYGLEIMHKNDDPDLIKEGWSENGKNYGNQDNENAE